MSQAYELVASNETRLFTQMELATLFFAHAYKRYLKDGGTIAFVMPRSVLTGAQQHRRFRQQFDGQLAKVLDLKGVSPPLQIPRLRPHRQEGGQGSEASRGGAERYVA